MIIFFVSNAVFAEPFSFRRVSLDKTTSSFGVERTIRDPNTGKEETGYHTGIDYNSEPSMEKDYTAGVWGVLSNLPHSDFNTINIDPLGNNEFNIQYLHNAIRYKKDREIVAPWTVIGKTDTVSSKPITGIHLHLQVINKSGAPIHVGWDRNFIDPERWEIGNPVGGMWVRDDLGSDDWNVGGTIFKMNVREIRRISLMNDEIGSRGERSVYEENFQWVEDTTMWCGRTYSFNHKIISREANAFTVERIYNNDCTVIAGSTIPNCCKKAEMGPLKNYQLTLGLKEDKLIKLISTSTGLDYHKVTGATSAGLAAGGVKIPPISKGKLAKEVEELRKKLLSSEIKIKIKDLSEIIKK